MKVEPKMLWKKKHNKPYERKVLAGFTQVTNTALYMHTEINLFLKGQ